MTVLALDLGSNMGWAVSESHQPVTPGNIAFGTQHFNPKGRTEGAGMRYFRFQSWLNEMARSASNPISAVYFEDVRARQPSVKADHAYGGFLATLTAWCEHHKIPYLGVYVGEIKKSATGKGNAKKEKMVFAAQMLGFDVSDDNAADAILLLKYALETHVN